MTFDNKVAVVTGAGSGIGQARAVDLAARGVSVVVTDINVEAAEDVVKQIEEAGGTAAAFRADSSSPEDNKVLVDFAVETYGKLNYAVNNAGIAGENKRVGELDTDNWAKVIDLNLNGVLYGMRYQVPVMLEAGAEESAIVNMASIHGSVAVLGNAAYTAAKHGVVGLTKNAAAEYGPEGLRVNAVGPA